MSDLGSDSHSVAEAASRVIDDSIAGDGDGIRRLAELLRSSAESRDSWIAQIATHSSLETHYGERSEGNLHSELRELAATELRRQRRGRRLIIASIISGGGLAAVLLFGVLPALMLPAVQSSRDAAREASSRANMKQLYQALNDFHEEHNALPAAYSTAPNGRSLISWRVYLLPHLGHEELFSKFHLDEPWDSPHNIKLLPEMPAVYRSPLSAKGSETVYVALPLEDALIRAPETAAGGSRPPLGASIQEVKDGTANTVMIVEVDEADAVPWTKPVDHPEFASQRSSRPRDSRISCIHALLADGSVIAVNQGVPLSAITKSGGEPAVESY